MESIRACPFRQTITFIFSQLSQKKTVFKRRKKYFFMSTLRVEKPVPTCPNCPKRPNQQVSVGFAGFAGFGLVVKTERKSLIPLKWQPGKQGWGCTFSLRRPKNRDPQEPTHPTQPTGPRPRDSQYPVPLVRTGTLIFRLQRFKHTQAPGSAVSSAIFYLYAVSV